MDVATQKLCLERNKRNEIIPTCSFQWYGGHHISRVS